MDKLEIAKEAVIIYFEENLSVEKAIEKAKKECLGVDQNNQSTLDKWFNSILPLGVELDNGILYIEDTGETIGDIEEVLR